MVYRVRPAELADHPHIRAFTEGTFAWGDYVGDSFPRWLEDPSIFVAVAEDDAGVAVAVGTARMPSSREVWMASARVHPDHRRQRLGSMLNEAGVEWGRAHGAQVARLLIEDWNEAPQVQVAQLGYRQTCGWVFARRADLQSDPNPMRNGGPRVPGPERLLPASRAEIDEAWVAWNSGALLRPARGLVSHSWIFWTMTVDDLVAAKSRSALWTCPSGWVIAELDEEGARLAVTWLQASPSDYRRVIRACLDFAVEGGLSNLAMWLPADPQMMEVLTSLGFDRAPSHVWEMSL